MKRLEKLCHGGYTQQLCPALDPAVTSPCLDNSGSLPARSSSLKSLTHLAVICASSQQKTKYNYSNGHFFSLCPNFFLLDNLLRLLQRAGSSRSQWVNGKVNGGWRRKFGLTPPTLCSLDTVN